jgi:membrane protein required for colicin V production
MNWLDIVLLILVGGSVAASLSKGLTREVLGLTSSILALLLGIWFYGTAGAFLLPYVSSKSIANFCGFLIVFCGVLMLGTLAAWAVGRLLKATGLSFFDRILGAAFGAVRGLLLAIALVMAIMAFARDPKSPPRSVVRSRFAPYVVKAADVCVAIAPYELKDGFRKTYEQVRSVWHNALKKGIRDLPKTEEHEREI